MSDIYLVGVSDDGGSGSAVDFAANRAKASGASVTVLHVLDWSPFSFLTPEELNERHKRREEELVRGQTAIVDPIVAKLKGEGINVDGMVRHGKPADVIASVADDIGAIQIYVGRTSASAIGARVFGSTAANLIQIANVPVTMVP
ncbi:MAG: universal stress protein [Hyphomicrobiales bacterium]